MQSKFYYFRLPLSITQLKGIRDVSVKEVTSDENHLSSSFHQWFSVLKSNDRIELIALPSIDEKRVHYLHLKIEKNDNTSLDDIFILDVLEEPPPPTIKYSGPRQDCIIQVKPFFTGVKNVWKVISYLLPSILRQNIDKEVQLKYNHENNGDEESNLIQQRIASLFSIQTFSGKSDDVRNYKITIEKQECDDGNGKISTDYLEYNLKKLGLEYNKVKVVKPLPNPDSFGNDYFESQLLSTKIWAQKSPYDDSSRIKARRHVEATPALNPDWTTLSTPIVDALLDDSQPNIDDRIMTRVVPILKSPTLTTPYPSRGFHSEISNRALRVRHPHQKFHALYTTPVLSPEPPTERIDDIITPTPVFAVISTPSFTIKPETAEYISATPSFSLGMTSSIFPDIVSSTESTTTSFSTDSTPTSVNSTFSTEMTISEEITTAATTSELPKMSTSEVNISPVIHKRIPKLNLTVGKYWRYRVPNDSFFDTEDGWTRSLSLSFLISDLKGHKNDSPPADYWIQFDNSNQMLYALPMEINVGRHNEFILIAEDSRGKRVDEELEIHVRQNPSYRAFNHNFILYNVTWGNNYPVLVEALAKLGRKLVRIFGDHNLNSFTVQSVENVDNTFTISWTNSSLPTHPCPKETIHNLYGKLADLNTTSEGTSSNPSRLLIKATSPEFQISGVGLRLLSSCSGSPPTEGPIKTLPKLRNPIDLLKFKYGQIFRYEISKDMFYSPRGGSTRDLELSLLTIDGHIPPRDGFIAFDAKKQEIYGLALITDDISSKEFQIVARDPETGLDANDVFVVQFEGDNKPPTFETSVSLSLMNDFQMDIDARVLLAHKIATNLLSDSDSGLIRVLNIKKYPHRVDLNRKKREDVQQFDYEYVWTNISLESDNTCPIEDVQKSIVHQIFRNDEKTLLEIKEKFVPEFNIHHIGFKSAGVCHGLLAEKELGIKPHGFFNDTRTSEASSSESSSSEASSYDSTTISIISTISTATSPPSTSIVDFSSTNSNETLVEKELDEHMKLTALITVTTVMIMFILCCSIVVFILISYRRKQERFELSSVIRSSNGYSAEREAFLQKGRVPVILESDLQQQQFLNH
ncbi:Dystroglycan-like protein [Dinothrombium tinctorium]|uniref:Dystroglycan-like protein n=1 Tax=Dinothrombium tinctorium TaxID=1965070 RepID=A0A3S3PHB3_9ACAR|nr:Dystroglycan-like protein [Dinothrombium tinctorium]